MTRQSHDHLIYITQIRASGKQAFILNQAEEAMIKNTKAI